MGAHHACAAECLEIAHHARSTCSSTRHGAHKRKRGLQSPKASADPLRPQSVFVRHSFEAERRLEDAGRHGGVARQLGAQLSGELRRARDWHAGDWHQQMIRLMEGRVDGIQHSFDEAEASLDVCKAEYGAYREAIEGERGRLEEELLRMQTELATALGDTAQLRARLSHLEAEHPRLHVELAQHKEDGAHLIRRLDTLEKSRIEDWLLREGGLVAVP
mmetsp:Transcript_79317/g.208304  ORF Transcript_79317/g.208304 Transcript_79317/m.208304 type:complete len:218 (+) Transcript_79317:68-721(+)